MTYPSIIGSPPRPWGRPKKVPRPSFPGRFTPTPVGTATPRSRRRSRSSVHPHARGDGTWRWRVRLNTSGSPPRPWGRRISDLAGGVLGRFTPTPVGTAPGTPAAGCPGAVHPHARGDGSRRVIGTLRRIGSPPRPWGRLQLWSNPGERVRFTPTPVGTAIGRLYGDQADSVHPHARGDGIDGKAVDIELVGSPPRPWGRPGRNSCRSRPGRFTPTPVGTASRHDDVDPSTPVHPHARGDGSHVGDARYHVAGSPPRPWGRQCHCRCHHVALRFTPTPVGTARGRRTSTRRHSVHPHARGDGERVSWVRG